MQLDPKFLLAVFAAIMFFLLWRKDRALLVQTKKKLKEVVNDTALQINIRAEKLSIIAENKKNKEEEAEG